MFADTLIQSDSQMKTTTTDSCQTFQTAMGLSPEAYVSSLTRQQFAGSILCQAQKWSGAGPALLHLHPGTLGEQMSREEPTDHCRRVTRTSAHTLVKPFNVTDYRPALQFPKNTSGSYFTPKYSVLHCAFIFTTIMHITTFAAMQKKKYNLIK